MDQVSCDTNCLADRHLSGFDHRLRDVRLALGSVNRLTGRFAAICSTFKSDTRTIPDAHSDRGARNESNTDSCTDTDAVTKSSADTGAPSDSSPPPPITSLIGFEHLNVRHPAVFSSRNDVSFSSANHNETLSVAVICINNPDRLAVSING